MSRSFNNYGAYKRDLAPNASKADYLKFLTSLQATRATSFDSNIANAIEYNKRLIAHKDKEQGMRTCALDVNSEHSVVKNYSQKQIDLHRSVQKQACVEPRNRPSFNSSAYIVAPHNYVSSILLSLIVCACRPKSRIISMISCRTACWTWTVK